MHELIPAPLAMLQMCCDILRPGLVPSRTGHALHRQTAVAVRDVLFAGLGVASCFFKAVFKILVSKIKISG